MYCHQTVCPAILMKFNCWKMDRGSLTKFTMNCRHWIRPENQCRKSKFQMTSVSDRKNKNEVEPLIFMYCNLLLQKSSQTIHPNPVLKNNLKMVKRMVQLENRLNQRRQPFRYAFFFNIYTCNWKNLNISCDSIAGRFDIEWLRWWGCACESQGQQHNTSVSNKQRSFGNTGYNKW